MVRVYIYVWYISHVPKDMKRMNVETSDSSVPLFADVYYDVLKT